MKIELHQGNCLEVMKSIPDGSVDMILCDPPYGTTACKWDSVIDLTLMWEQLKRIIKPNGAIVLTASQPFTSKLIMSNFDMFKYNLVWKKNTCTGFMQAKTKPLKSYEDIVVFGDFKLAAQYFKGTYNPQGIESNGTITYSNKRKDDHITGNRKENTAESNKGYPKDVLEFNSESKTVHPTQKPVALMEYLIKTYTNEGETVLDFTMGSGTTGVACCNLSRSFIGIEMDENYFNIASKRIAEAQENKLKESCHTGKPMTNTTKLPDGHYFVFGSNEAGRHGKGAALCAMKHFGAIYGQGHGEQGSSYAIATKDASLRSLSLDTIAENVRVLLQHATNHPHKQFAVSRVACGLAGYKDDEIAPMFKGHPSNVYFLAEGWREFMSITHTSSLLQAG